MEQPLGTVISTFEGPSTQQFAFVVTQPSVRRGQYVLVNSQSGGPLVGFVSELVRANRYFERAESVSEYEKQAKKNPSGQHTFLTEFPALDWEYVIANCRIMGILDGKDLTRVGVPPAPGDRVLPMPDDQLFDFCGFMPDGLDMGKLVHHPVQAKLDLTRLMQKHLAILGISGSGKSYSVAVLLEELMNRTPQQGRVSVVVFDVHGEYLGFADARKNPQFAQKTVVVDCNKVRIACHKLNSRMLKEFIPDMSSSGGRELDRIIFKMRKSMKEGGSAFDLPELIAQVESSDMGKNVKEPLAAWLTSLRPLRLFSRSDYPSVKQVVKPGFLTIFDLSDVTNQKKKQIILAYFAGKMFTGRQKDKVPPFVLLVEEAHNFAREKVAKGGAISKSIIETIAREGRKFGASLCLVSQRPVQLSTTALSQCNSCMIFRITNPFDLKHIQESAEAIDSDTAGAITSLRVGECIVIGEAVNQPLFIRVRQRTTHKGGKGSNLADLARNYEKNSTRELAVEDVESFI
jgi:DNA helicase HerA-like ATPase